MANNAVTLKAVERTVFGKGSARRARRDGQVPVVVYGHGSEPRHLLLDEHSTRLTLRGNDNALVELDIDGEVLLAIAKDVQRHPIRPGIQHVDFLLVNRNERVEVEVPVVVVGDAEPGTLHMIELAHVIVSAPAVSIPESIEVDVTGVAGGAAIRMADIPLPAGVTAVTDAEADVVNVAEGKAVASEVAAEESAEAEAE
ncbi:50S ribosomal protein L25/general stress protein Ctc [Actinomyces howellii]|uniref:Large ribosomal subunit protein bL25 n=1 Tax=Actinomyces howellii TaxID=52771 RepID=A0A3S4SP47_9ACTO|nr:50S ribosomal protein L25/general stress protein Ctc [Actinomyces howellii]VEG29700.1 50S ribosomal protein L25 [Actinomyces howellii]